MEAVPSLCASGTVGVAAIGFAFGHRQRLSSTRPATTRRKSMLRGATDESHTTSAYSSTSSPPPPSSSARLQKRSSLGRPISPSNRTSGGGYSRASTPSGRLHEEADCTDLPSIRVLERTTNPAPAAPEYKGTGTAKSSWLRRMSTLSSLKTGSHDSTPPPGSPSLSCSNGSATLILPSAAQGHLTAPPNKLVKRSSSQRLLQGNSTPNSTLRRPATSHQRIATLKQRYSSGEELSYRSPLTSSPPFDHLQEDRQAFDESLQVWLPFFTCHTPTPTKEVSMRKCNANIGTSRKEPAGSTVPDVHELPTLLLATSISSSGPSENMRDDIINRPKLSDARRPSTAIGLESFIPPSSSRAAVESNTQPDLKSRPSFSITDMFPSTSSSRWKIPRASSLKRNKGPSNVDNGRRVSSAPMAENTIKSPSSISAEAGKLILPKTRTLGRRRGSLSATTSNPQEIVDDLSSPLPPLNRLSTFEIDLPTTAPSYPIGLQPRPSPSSPKLSTTPSPPFSSPLSPAIARNKSHRPSGAPSDRASTLLGSDHENSRFLSSDDDDYYDFRSETVYSSTRTGATGSSHSGIRRPPIETIFDESPPAELPQHKLIALQDLISSQSFVESDAHGRRNAEAEQSLSSSVRATAPCKDVEYPPTPTHAADRPLPVDFPSSPPDIPFEVGRTHSVGQDMDDFPDDDWSVKDVENSNPALPRYNLTSNNDPSTPLDRSPRFSFSPNGAVAGGDSLANSDIFKWSEQSLTEKESLQGSLPRPKTVHGIKNNDARGSRLGGRRGSNALHLRSQSVPVPPDGSGHRSHNNTSKLESWMLGNKGVSEDWDGDFDFEETHRTIKQTAPEVDAIRSSSSSGMLVPRAILDRQASVRGQFGHVKELTLLVEELKRLRQQANVQGILHGQSAELWKEAEGIINLATLDDEEQDFLSPRSPPASGSEFDAFDEDSPSSRSRRRSGYPSPREDRLANQDDISGPQVSTKSSPDKSKSDTLPTSRPRKESVAKAKSVLETIHQQRSEYNSTFIDAKASQKKLPFDTTSLRDLVTRAGVVTRALKEIVRRSETASPKIKPRSSTPPDPPFSQIFQQPPSPLHEINGHMKMMTVV